LRLKPDFGFGVKKRKSSFERITKRQNNPASSVYSAALDSRIFNSFKSVKKAAILKKKSKLSHDAQNS